MRIYTYIKRETILVPASGVGSRSPAPTREVKQFTAQDYVDRLLKLIPAEVIVSYPMFKGFLNSISPSYVGITIAAILALVSTVILRTVGLREDQRPQKSAVAISISACLLWIYEQGGYFFFPAPKGWENLAQALAIFLVIVAPRFIKGEPKYI